MMSASTMRQRIERDLAASAQSHPDAATYDAMLAARDRIERMLREEADAVDVIRHGVIARLRQEADGIETLPEVLLTENEARDNMARAVQEIAAHLPDGDTWLRLRHCDDHAIDVLDDGLSSAECGASASPLSAARARRPAVARRTIPSAPARRSDRAA